MEARTKKIWAIVGISAATLTILGVGFFLWRRKKRKEEREQIPPEPVRSSPSQSNTYTSEEVKNMQAWLLATGIKNENQLIVETINNTGGIDGIMGNGFRTALTEAIQKGYIESLNDLYKISNK